MCITACDFGKRQRIAPPYDPFSIFTGVADSASRTIVNRALDKYTCANGRIGNVTTYRFAGDANRSSHYVNPWSITNTIGGSIAQVFLGKSERQDLLVVSRVRGISGESLYGTLYLCEGDKEEAERKFITADALVSNFYTTGTLGLIHNERSCDFDGAEVNSYLCISDSAFSMENSPPCPPGLIKVNVRFASLCR